jgi:hypothetical protein
MLGRHQIAVDQVGMRLGQRREDDHDHVDVGRHRLELATAVRAAQFGAARHWATITPMPWLPARQTTDRR